MHARFITRVCVCSHLFTLFHTQVAISSSRTRAHTSPPHFLTWQARKILSSMARRVIQNKIIMFGIIAFLLAAIGIILYVKLKPSSSSSSGR